jgi:hypothetical protein
MDKKGELNTGGVVLIFIGIIVAFALIGAIASVQNQVTTLQSTTGESTDLSATSCFIPALGHVNVSNSLCNLTADYWYPSGDWRASESQCYLSSATVGNGTVTYTANTDYRLFEEEGVVQLLNTTTTTNATSGNNAVLAYSFCDEGYNKDGGSRSMAGLWTLFAALAIVAFVLLGIKEWINRK